MSSFTTPLLCEIMQEVDEDGRTLAKVFAPFRYYLNDPDGESVFIHSGYITNFANSPRLVWFWVPPLGPYAKAVVVHDFLCEYAVVTRPDGSKRRVSRAEADLIFFQAMSILNVPEWKRLLMYAGVRVHAIRKGLE